MGKLFTLKSARINVDLTQSEVVEILKEKFDYRMTRQKLADYENDASEIPVNLSGFLAEIYFLTVDDIFFGNKSTLSYTYRAKQKQEVK